MMEIICSIWITFFTIAVCTYYFRAVYFKSFESDLKNDILNNGFKYLSSRRKAIFEKKPFPDHWVTMWDFDLQIYAYRFVKFEDKDGNIFESCAELRLTFMFKVNRILWEPPLKKIN